jgi:L-ascorbate 6-phosphate lactonase
VKLVYLGQSGVVLHTRRARVAIDPYLSNSVDGAHPDEPGLWARAFPPPVRPDQLAVDAVCCTHVHDDHCDPGTIQPLLAGDARLFVYGPPPVVAQLGAWGLGDRVRGLRTGERCAVADGVFVTAIPAAHPDVGLDADGQAACVGFVVEADDRTIFHAGDSVVHPGLVRALARWRFDVLLLPVNGRDAEREARGIVGNMDAAEAADLARALNAPPVIALHNDLFPANSIPWPGVADAFGDVPWRRLAPGEAMTIKSCL